MQNIQVDWTRIILVKDACLAVIYHQSRISKRTIDGRNHGHYHETQTIDFSCLSIFCLDEFREAKIAKPALKQVQWIGSRPE